MGYFFLKTFCYGSVAFISFRVIAKPIIRKVSGWEDSESHEVNNRKINEFLEKQEGKQIKELKEGENYF